MSLVVGLGAVFADGCVPQTVRHRAAESQPDNSAGDGGDSAGALGGAESEPAQGGAAGDGGAGGGQPTPDVAGAGNDSTRWAVTKFCNSLTGKNSKAVSLVLEIRGQGAPLALSATSGACAPLASFPCQVVPAGEPLTLLLRDGAKLLATSQWTLGDGQAWLFVADVDNGGAPFIDASQPFNPDGCAATQFADLY